jgi:hypothetical protein
MSYDDILRLVDIRTRQNAKRNTIPINVNESIEHLLAKVKEAYRLRKEGKDFYAEAIFSHGRGRADLLVWSDDEVEAVEVVHTEDISVSGKSKYPVPVRFVYTDVGNKGQD